MTTQSQRNEILKSLGRHASWILGLWCTGTTSDDIKADVKELVGIVIEDKISVKRIIEYRVFAEKRHMDMLKWKLEHDLKIAYITDIDITSKRFADKLLSVLSKYDEDEDRVLIIQCINLLPLISLSSSFYDKQNMKTISLTLLLNLSKYRYLPSELVRIPFLLLSALQVYIRQKRKDTGIVIS